MPNPTLSPKLMARPRSGFLVRQLMFVVLLCVTLRSGMAAEPEKISDSALQQIRALQAEKLSRSTIHRKLDSQFVFQLKQNRGQVIAQGVTKLQPDLKLQADGRVLVDIDANVTEALLAQIQQSGGTVINNFPQYRAIRALVTLDQLESLASSADVKFIRRAREAHTHTGSVTSEGDVTHRANMARNTFGVTGQNVKVGVLSDSIDFLANSQATGDLGDVTVLPGQGGSGGGEGTAMLEIIHDVAPSAQLYFATAFNGEASFAQNILNLRSNGCEIIVDDVFYFDESPFQDGIIAQAVNTVTASGALYFSSAGNEGNQKDQTSGTWEGNFVDGGPASPPVNLGGGSIHSFGPATFNTVIAPGYQVVNLFWADPLGASGNDYDLFVLDSTGTYVVSSSLNLQDGTQDPFEEVYRVNSGERIVVVKAAGDARFLHLDVARGKLSISTSGATKGHSAAAAAFSVAAVDAATAYPNPFSGGLQNPVETFSADGPRRVFFNADGSPITPGNFSATGGAVRQKPDLAAADGVMTLVFGRFFGTSAAAPHAAAIGALLWSYDPTLTPSQIRTALTGSALDIEAPGLDPNSGAGLVMADSALQSLPPRPVVIAGGSTVLAESCPNDVLDPVETVTVAFSLLNVGVANTANLVVTLLNSGGVTSPSGPQNYGVMITKGGPVSRPFSFTAAGICGGTNIATLQLQDGTNNLGTVSFAFRLGNQRVALAENFDGVTPPALPAGWARFQSGAGAGWVTTNVASDTPPNSVFVPDPNAVSDKRLTSPVFPVTTASAQLSFRHRFYTYNYGYDGGVLEISTNGVTFTDILAAGGSFVANGYLQTLYTGYGNPLQDRQAWTGSSGGFITTIVNLPASAAGQNVQLRWRFGSGSGVGGGEGWYLDTISLTDGYACCGTVPNDLVVRITDAPDPVVVGGTLNYTINIFNTGPAPAADVSLSDVLPANFTFRTLTRPPGIPPGPVANGGGTITFNLGTLAGGGSATLVIGGTADAVGWLTNRVTVSRSDPDANTNDNSATAVTSVILPSLSINDVTLVEGNAGTTNAVFTVNVSPPAYQTVSVSFSATNGTAIAGSDFVPAAGTLVFAPGVTNLTFAVPVTGDRVNEADEVFFVNLSHPTNAVLARSQGVGTILNDDPLPSVSVSDATVVVPKAGTTNVMFNVRLSVPSGQPVTMYPYTSDGTAHGGSDYVYISDQLTFNPGETNKTISVVVNAHVSVKPAQTFTLNLPSVNNAKLGHNPGLGTIITSLPGQLDNFDWSAIASPQSNGAPFAVTLTAKDYFGGAVSNFNGMVNLTGLIGLPSSRPLVVNGGFETGDFTGWVKEKTGSGDFVINNGFFNPASGDRPLPPFAGSFNALTDPSGPGVRAIYQEITIPLNATSPQLHWADRIRNHAGQFQHPNQEFRVEIRGPANNVLAIAYSTNPGDPLLNDWVQRSYDLDAFRGQTIRIAFVEQDYFYYFNLHLDDVIVTTVSSVVPVTPTSSGNFTNGVWSGSVTVQQPATNVTLYADDGLGHVGQSNPFDVLPTPGQTTHFVWSPIASPQSNAAPFAVSLTAQDYFNATATNFTGTVAFDGSGVVGIRSNTILGAPAHTDVYSYGAAYTFGYSFTPRTNMMVTHVRHYFGSIVKIWTDAGVLVASRSVASTPGTWRETALTTPLQLLAGQRYRIGVYTGGGNSYSRNDLPGTFADGTIDQSYEVSGNGFPTNASSPRWWFVDLRYSSADVAGPVFVSPASSGNFIAGVWSGNLAVFQAATNVTLRADDGVGHLGRSLPFNVVQVSGQVTHFVWSPIPSPQSNGTPFGVTITAQDYLNGTASNYTGRVALSGSGVVATRTNTILGAPPHTEVNSYGAYTFGYSFTPRTNMTVTHVRHYFGSIVKIWTDGGALLATRNVTSAVGTWRETELTTPLQLLAGQRYRVSVYTTGNFYYRFDLPGTFADGTIDQGYYVDGNAFPKYDDSPRWFFVDLRYRVDTFSPIPISPAISDNFSNGVWNGSVTAQLPATNVTLRADDGLGHAGVSNPFDVAVQYDISLGMFASPDPVFLGTNLTYTLTVANTGPTAATGVVVTNLLPPAVAFISATSSQGSCVPTGGALICDLGTVPGGTNATITIIVQPTAIGVITNVATVARNEADVLLANNTASAVTRVRSPFSARVAIYGAPGDDSWNTDVRNKLVAAGASALAGSFSSVSAVLVRSGLPVPTLAQLQQYDAVLVYSGNSFNDSVAFGDVLADYVDNGGGVVLATYAFYTGAGLGISGRISTGGYLPFTQGSANSGGNLTLVADDPLHPILGGVSSFNGGSGSYHNYPISPTAGTELVAHWSNNQPLVGAKQLTSGRMVGLNFYPPSSAVSGDFWQSNTDGGLLMANALLWAAQRPNDISIRMTDAPDPVAAGANLTYTLTITNSGPSAATGVTVSNLLPSNVTFFSAGSSQGTCTQSSGVVTCNLGTVPGGDNATLTIVVVPTLAGTTITNSATVARAEIDNYLGNNTATVTTAVTAPAVAVADAAVVEGNGGTTNLVFAVTLTAPSAQTITVVYATTDGTASAGSDYLGTNGVLTFPPGTTNRTIAVTVLGDILVEGNETLFVNLSSPTNGMLLRNQGVGTIVNTPGPAGQLNHFAWSTIPSPQFIGAPIAVTITAQDYFNSTATNFAGSVALSGVAGVTNNNILGAPTHTDSSSGDYTLGYAFTPHTNITVTHVRHYFGTSVSIWTEAGVLVAAQNVSSTAGTWRETALSTPVQLSAGHRYRVGVYTGGGNYYLRLDLPGTFADGTIDQSYEAVGNTFPAIADPARWWFVDLRYRVDAIGPVPVSPFDSGNFSNGVWSGSVIVQQPGINLTLWAADGLGHSGQSLPFNVAGGPVPPVAITLQSSGNQMQLTWANGILQSASQAAGPYTDVVVATSPYTVTFSAPQQFFRVRVN